MAATIHPKQDQFLSDGKILPYGAYNDIITNTSLKRWDSEGGLFKRRRTQRKVWMFLGVYSKDLMIGLAVADAGFLGNAFAYFYVPSEDLYLEQKVILPYGFSGDFDPELFDRWSLRNFNIESHNGILRGTATGKFQLNIEMKHNDRGLSFICPSVDRPFNFTYKNQNIESKATVIYKNKTYEINGKFGGIDFSKGYPPRQTIWNWAAINGQTKEGLPIGMNLFRGHNGKYENAAWIGEDRLLLSNTNFKYDKSKPLDKQVWVLQTEDGLVDVKFTPSKSRSEKINAGLLSHDFIQPFGTFEGTIKHKDITHEFVGYGPVEEHESLW